MRGVIYNDRQGGYINNVPSTFTRSSTDRGAIAYNGGVVPTNSVSINNNNVVGNAINPVTYTGIRVGALAKINDDWNALLTQSYQNIDAQGVFYEMPRGTIGASLDANAVPIGGQPLPPLSVNLFNPSFNKDKFENTALVVNGKIGDLKLVYSGAYLVRNVEQTQDYTNYARGSVRLLLSMRGILEHESRGRPVLHAEHDVSETRESPTTARSCASAHRRTSASAASSACTGKNTTLSTRPTGGT